MYRSKSYTLRSYSLNGPQENCGPFAERRMRSTMGWSSALTVQSRSRIDATYASRSGCAASTSGAIDTSHRMRTRSVPMGLICRYQR